MATSRSFMAKHGLDNNGNPLTNVGTVGSSLSLSGAHAVTISVTGPSNITFPASGTLLSDATVPTVNDGTLTLAVSGVGLTGSASFTANQSGNSSFTVTSNATSANTVSTIVARDASGNFSAGTITAALTGNASTATALATGRTISTTGDVSFTTAAFDGTGNVSATATLATVNASPQTDTFGKITVNDKGLVTATSAVAAGDITTALGYTPLSTAGGTLTGPLTLNADPSGSLHAATKQYVDNVASGLNIHQAVRTATSSDLTATYNNGAAGVGATLTGTGNIPAINGITPVVGNRVLVKDQSTNTQNGIYVVTTDTTNWVMTRATDFDNSPTSEVMAGDATYVQEGTLGGTQWVLTSTGSLVIGTSGLVFSQFGGPGEYTAGTGITIASNAISLATGNTLSLFNLSTSGLVARTAANTVTARSIAVSGTGLTVSNGDAISGNPTITSNATNANTASTIVARDASGNFSAGTITAALTGNASTATALATGATLSITGDLAWTSPTFTGSGNVTATGTLATVNASPQTDTFRKITVNGKGLVTATSAVSSGDITTALGYTPLSNAGGTLTGALTIQSRTNISATLTNVSTTTQTTIDTFPIATYRSAKYLVQVHDTTASSYHLVEILVIHNGTTVYKTEYGEITSAASLGTFDANISGGNLLLQFTATAATSKAITVSRTAITV